MLDLRTSLETSDGFGGLTPFQFAEAGSGVYTNAYTAGSGIRGGKYSVSLAGFGSVSVGVATRSKAAASVVGVLHTGTVYYDDATISATFQVRDATLHSVMISKATTVVVTVVARGTTAANTKTKKIIKRQACSTGDANSIAGVMCQISIALPRDWFVDGSQPGLAKVSYKLAGQSQQDTQTFADVTVNPKHTAQLPQDTIKT